MGQPSVRVVVGQGDPSRQGFLRTVLEDDGLDVVGEAATTSHLARLLTDERPDVVVLDDSIGIAAVQVATEIVPRAKVVVVWPSAVVPISGAIRVEPSEVLTTLAATVALAGGTGVPGGIDRPEWIEKVRKDPATLRELLAARGGVPTRPSVTELQRRGHRLHPSPRSPRRTAKPKPTAGEEPSDKDRGAVVTPIPLAAAAAAAAAEPEEASWNRRLGVVALGGAAVASALTIALAFSNRAPTFTAAEPFLPPFNQPSLGPQNPSDGDNGPGQPGGDNTPPDGNTNGGTNGGTGGGTTPGGNEPGIEIRGTLLGPLTPPEGGGNNNGRNSDEEPRGPLSDIRLPGTHGEGEPGGPSTTAVDPGKSGSHNPHGGPPGWEHRPDHRGGQSASHWGGQSSNAGGRSAAHANKHAHKQ